MNWIVSVRDTKTAQVVSSEAYSVLEGAQARFLEKVREYAPGSESLALAANIRLLFSLGAEDEAVTVGGFEIEITPYDPDALIGRAK